MRIMETNSSEETLEAGRKLGRAAKAGDIFTLDGELGAIVF